VDARRKPALRAFMSLVAKRKDLTKEYLEHVVIFDDLLRKQGLDTRQTMCWAVALSGLRIATAYAGTNVNEKIVQDISAAISAYSVVREEQSALNRIWTSAESLYVAGKFGHHDKSRWFRIVVVDGKEYLGIWLSHMMETLAINRMLPITSKRSTNYFTSHVIEEHWYAGTTKNQISVGGRHKARLLLIEPPGRCQKNKLANYPHWIYDAAMDDDDSVATAHRDEEHLALHEMQAG
jgi:hypothetical protein